MPWRYGRQTPRQIYTAADLGGEIKRNSACDTIATDQISGITLSLRHQDSLARSEQFQNGEEVGIGEKSDQLTQSWTPVSIKCTPLSHCRSRVVFSKGTNISEVCPVAKVLASFTEHTSFQDMVELRNNHTMVQVEMCKNGLSICTRHKNNSPTVSSINNERPLIQSGS